MAGGGASAAPVQCSVLRVLAGTGSGRDAPPAADRFIFRQQALDWLRAELQTYEKNVASNPADVGDATYKAMHHWLGDRDLAPVREADAIGLLPSAEQGAWKQLWIDVRRLHAATIPPPRPTK